MNIARLALGIMSAVLLCSVNAQTNAPPPATNPATTMTTTNMPAIPPCKTLQRAMAGKHQHIVAYGTSLTWAGSWVEKLRLALYCEKAKYNFTISNVGQNSQWTGWGLNMLDERVLKRSPDAVIIEFGINDAYEGYQMTLEQSRKNLETMIDRILQKNPDCDIILMTMNAVSGKPADVRPQLEEHYQIYRDVAKARGLVLVDMYPTWKKLQQDDPVMYKKYVPDGLHPGPLGDANVIVPAITKAMGL